MERQKVRVLGEVSGLLTACPVRLNCKRENVFPRVEH